MLCTSSRHSIVINDIIVSKPKEPSRFARLLKDGEIAFIAVLAIIVATQFIGLTQGRALRALPYLELSAGAIYTAHSVRNFVSKINALKASSKAHKNKEVLYWALATLCALGIMLGYLTKLVHGSMALSHSRFLDGTVFTKVIPITFAAFGGLGALLVGIDLIRHNNRLKRWKKSKRKIFKYQLDGEAFSKSKKLKREILAQSFFFSGGHKKAYDEWTSALDLRMYGHLCLFNARQHPVLSFSDQTIGYTDWSQIAEDMRESAPAQVVETVQEEFKIHDEKMIQQITADSRRIGRYMAAGLAMSLCFLTAGLIHLFAPTTIKYSTMLISIAGAIGVGRFAYSRTMARKRIKEIKNSIDGLQDKKERLHSYSSLGYP
jgi:hypothetical protein